MICNEFGLCIALSFQQCKTHLDQLAETTGNRGSCLGLKFLGMAELMCPRGPRG